ncbi:nucleotidyltransferase family protein [Synechococcus sp. PCC 7336]|uniref:nucleotidyltransferase family protein n=1 Tax=Synechococcus sp. PCC 7336 TaxID=195250 RepID=UPI000349115C|nr:nucleotidyltransferase family protein [Synechococcus sp. PCC 7336]
MQLGNIELPTETVDRFCQKWQIAELALFGSVLRDDFRPDSDLDILISFAPNTPWTLLDLITMQQELEQIAGRNVDLIEKHVIETSDNWIRRNEILSTARVVYS